MKAIRFRCPKCRAPHSAGAESVGQVVVCSSCFGPVIVPMRAVAVSPSLTLAVAVGAVALVAGGAGYLAGRSPSRVESPPPPSVEVAAKVEPPPPPVVDEPPAPPPPLADPRPVVLATSTDPDRPLAIRRRQTLGQDALRRQLAGLPELVIEERTEVTMLALHQILPTGEAQGKGDGRQAAVDRINQASAARNRRRPSASRPSDLAKPPMHVARAESAPGDMMAMIAQVQPELAPLPWRMGEDCHLDREASEDLQALSRELRNALAKATPGGDTRPDAEKLRAALLVTEPEAEQPQGVPQAGPTTQAQATGNRRKGKSAARFLIPAAIPALTQLLMAERTPIRLVLADLLAKIDGREATAALARLACFDLAPEVRERSLLALRARPAVDYRPTMLEALRYPWAPIADHAAEALVALGDRDAVPALKDLLDLADPERPRTEIRDGKPVRVAKAMVQVNHLQNCVLCHAPSANPAFDMVRGRVPDESTALPPPVEYYANNSPGLFVRADVTYLRQDFSVTQPVEDAGPWPAYQRYDYLVADRPATVLGNGERKDYPQRQSALFAIRELKGGE